jgi:hypothetical protein
MAFGCDAVVLDILACLKFRHAPDSVFKHAFSDRISILLSDRKEVVETTQLFTPMEDEALRGTAPLRVESGVSEVRIEFVLGDFSGC